MSEVKIPYDTVSNEQPTRVQKKVYDSELLMNVQMIETNLARIADSLERLVSEKIIGGK